jgi:hypothetical protein
MPRATENRTKKGKYIELPEELWAQVKALADANDRDFREEIEHALQRHVADPPRIIRIEEVPPLAPATVEVRADKVGAATPTVRQDGPPAQAGPRPAGAHQDAPAGRTGGRKGRSGRRKGE